MAFKIFITGVTGYIGGSVAFHLIKKHPEIEITAIVRNDEQARIVLDLFKSIRMVLGDLNSADILSKESAAADIVIHCASSDHCLGATSIVDGLKSAPGVRPGYLIHTSGTGILVDQTVTPGTYHPKVYDDVHDIKALNSFPVERWHRNVDTIIQEASSKVDAGRGIRTAIICPPTIYGVGSGPIKKRSDQIPRLINSILQNKGAFTVNEGRNVWRNVHVADLADAYVLLVEEALKDNGGNANWNHEGNYYFAENGEHSWREISRLVAFHAFPKGYIKSLDVEPLSIEEIEEFEKAGPVLWGSNSRGFASRFKVLGWKPFREPISEWIPEAVEYEVNFPEGALRLNE